MESNLFDRQPNGILETVLSESEGATYVVNPTGEIIEELVEVADGFDGDPSPLRVLADGRTIRKVMGDFMVASVAADLITAGDLEVRLGDTLPENPLVVTAEGVMALVSVGGHVAGLTTDDEAFVGGAFEDYTRRWEDAEAYDLRTPAISEVRESLVEDLGEQAEEDFSEVLSSLETARGDGDGLDEVTISLLVAAKNEELFYDVSRWGENVGVASKATFSRVKNELEDTGLIETERVPVEVGRPRQRLVIDDDRLLGADYGQIASITASMLN